MNLRYLSDNNLIDATQKLATKEREILSEILHHLREIERRRLFSCLGYKSLFDYCVKGLGYSEDQAFRRTDAMRLLKEIPEVEQKINSGALNLSHLNLAQSLFRKETHSNQKKIEVLTQLENKPVREAQKIVLSLSASPTTFIPDKSRQVSEDLTELKFGVNEKLKAKIAQVRGLFAHTDPHLNMAELVDKLCDIAIEHKTAAFKKSRVTKYKKDRCEICQSTYALEIDHIVPRAKGGTNDPENLRTLCRSCNQRAAINEFGLHKMANFIDH